MWLVSFTEQSLCLRKEAEITCQASASRYIPEPALFHRLFPFHLVVDERLRVVQLGTGLRRMIPDLAPGALISAHLEVRNMHADEAGLSPFWCAPFSFWPCH